MKDRVAYDDAVDLLDADHKAVKKMVIDHAALCDDGAPAATRHQLAQRICQALSVHAQIEEEIFHPLVREAIPGHPCWTRPCSSMPRRSRPWHAST